jgi:hypothetical protein
VGSRAPWWRSASGPRASIVLARADDATASAQNRRQPGRCQRSTVSGRARRRWGRQFRWRRRTRTQKSLSRVRRRGRCGPGGRLEAAGVGAGSRGGGAGGCGGHCRGWPGGAREVRLSGQDCRSMLLPGGAQTFALLQAQTRPVFFVCAPKIEGDCRQSLVNTRPPVARPNALHRLLIALDQARQNRSTLVAWLIALRLPLRTPELVICSPATLRTDRRLSPRRPRPEGQLTQHR